MGTIQDMINKLERFQQEIATLPNKTVTIIPDKNGMIDRQCPKKNCYSYFKVHSEDLINIVKDEEVFCPFCRNNSKASEYFPTKQRGLLIENIRQSLLNHWHTGSSISDNIKSVKTSNEFELFIQCEKCKVRFAVVGAAYFCPCCGNNSVEKNAVNSIDKIILKATKINDIQDSLEKTFSKDEASILVKSIIEQSLSECISTLQSYSETKYNNLSKSPAPFNSFQNIEKSNRLWFQLRNQGFENWLTKKEHLSLIIYTQQRHLLEHKGGIVDSKYLKSTNDSIYTVGERIIISPKDIIVLGKIILKIVNKINEF
jgi:hypothetical protein